MGANTVFDTLGLRCLIALEREWVANRTPVSHIGKIFSVERDEEHHVVELWANPARGGHSRGQARDCVAESSKQVGEQSVAFVAESPTSATDDLLVDPSRVEGNPPARVDIQILKRNGFQESMLQRPKSVGCGLA